MGLKANEGLTDFPDPAKFRGCVADGPVSQFKKWRQLRLVEFANSFPDVLRQDEIEKGLELRVCIARR